jgi:cyclic pyranopterin phosphate synthase
MDEPTAVDPHLTHFTSSGAALMVPIAHKAITHRTATAVCTVLFSNSATAGLIRTNHMNKGDVLGTARIAAIMAAKKTSDLIPLCHPIVISHVKVDLEIMDTEVPGRDNGERDNQNLNTANLNEQKNQPHQHRPSTTDNNGCVHIRATVSCDGKTGVEMEALTAASTAALTVYDMCKAVDRGMRVDGLRVVLKEGGRSGRWESL